MISFDKFFEEKFVKKKRINYSTVKTLKLWSGKRPKNDQGKQYLLSPSPAPQARLARILRVRDFCDFSREKYTLSARKKSLKKLQQLYCCSFKSFFYKKLKSALPRIKSCAEATPCDFPRKPQGVATTPFSAKTGTRQKRRAVSWSARTRLHHHFFRWPKKWGKSPDLR